MRLLNVEKKFFAQLSRSVTGGIICLRKKGRILPELHSTTSPLGPIMTTPSSSSSTLSLPTISSSFTFFCACSTL